MYAHFDLNRVKLVLSVREVVDAPGTGKPGPNRKRLARQWTVTRVDDRGIFGTRTDDGHVAANNVEELW